MADETPAPLSDAEIARLHELTDAAADGPWFWSHVDSLDTHEGDVEMGLPTGIRGINPRVAENVYEPNGRFIGAARAAIPRLLATLAAYREIVAAVAGPGGPLTSDEDTGYSCIFCESDDWMPEGRYADVRHTADCPVTRARALLATSTPPANGAADATGTTGTTAGEEIAGWRSLPGVSSAGGKVVMSAH